MQTFFDLLEIIVREALLVLVFNFLNPFSKYSNENCHRVVPDSSLNFILGGSFLFFPYIFLLSNVIFDSSVNYSMKQYTSW